MNPLDHLLKEAEELRDYFRSNPGSGIEQSYWTTRLATLKEARIACEEHLNEFNKCKENPQYFMEKYASVKRDMGQRPETGGGVNVDKLVSNDGIEQGNGQKKGDVEEFDWNSIMTDPDSLIRLNGNVRDESQLNLKDAKIVQVEGDNYLVSYDWPEYDQLCWTDSEYISLKLYRNDITACHAPKSWVVKLKPDDTWLIGTLSSMTYDPLSFAETGRKVVASPVRKQDIIDIMTKRGVCRMFNAVIDGVNSTIIYKD